MIFKDECKRCGSLIAAKDPTMFGFVQAVHLLDEHPEAFDELAENARTMLEHAEDAVDDAEMDPMQTVKEIFGDAI